MILEVDERPWGERDQRPGALAHGPALDAAGVVKVLGVGSGRPEGARGVGVSEAAPPGQLGD